MWKSQGFYLSSFPYGICLVNLEGFRFPLQNGKVDGSSFGTIHFRRWQIFHDFWPLPPTVGSFLLLSVDKFGKFLTPSPPKKCRRLKWMVPLVFFIFSVIVLRWKSFKFYWNSWRRSILIMDLTIRQIIYHLKQYQICLFVCLNWTLFLGNFFGSGKNNIFFLDLEQCVWMADLDRLTFLWIV